MQTSIEDTYTRLIAMLDQHGAHYRLIEHAPEGRTELVSTMRGNTLSQAAKCIVLMVKNAKQTHCLRGHPFDEANTIYNMSDNPEQHFPHQPTRSSLIERH